MDFFIDNLVKKIIKDIIEHKNTLPDSVAVWKSLTFLMFKNYPALDVWNMMEEAYCEASNEQWFENKYPKEVFTKKFISPKKKRSVIKINLKQSRLKKLINDNLKITDVAEGYGLKVKKGMCVCPFHNDSQASLGFDDVKNIFHCFGCNAKGDIIEFKRRIKRCQKEKMQQKNF